MNWEYGVALDPTPALATGCAPYVDGGYVAGTGTRTAWEPAADAALGEVAGAGPADVDRAVAAARRALDGWAGRPGTERVRVLVRFAGLVAERAGGLAVLETRGTGRPVRLTRGMDLPAAVAHLRSCAGWSDKLGYAAPDPRPVGVVGASVADRRPLLAAVRGVAPALACGNAVVLVPDPDAPLSALALAETATEAGLPAGVLSVLPGAALPAGLDAVVAGKGAGGVHVVHDDAPLDQAVDGMVEALGTDRRVLVAESVADEFAALLVERVGRLRVGDPVDRNTDVGPAGSPARRDAAAALVAAAEEDGARSVAHPGPLPDRGPFLAPTVLLDVAPGTRAAAAEITGPVLPVLTFRTPAEAVALAGAAPTAAVWTDKGSRALWTAQRLRAHTVWVNAVDRFDPAASAAALAPYLAG